MSNSAGNNQANLTNQINPQQPLADRMTRPTGGSIQPVHVTEQEKKIERENNHHGTGSSLGEKISNALDFPGLNGTAPPAQTRKGL